MILFARFTSGKLTNLKNQVKLLIVDDNVFNQKILYYALKNYFEIESVNNGLEAIDLLEKQEFDVVIMDLSMPVMDGADATWQIRESDKFRNKFIPIIFVTTNDDDYEQTRCLDNGADDFLIKPVDTEQLISVINFHIEQKKIRQKQIK
jgi:CheY-like chemotaxis protein